MLKNLDYCLFFNDLDTEYDSDDDSDVDSDNSSGYIKSLKLMSWFSKYNHKTGRTYLNLGVGEGCWWHKIRNRGTFIKQFFKRDLLF